MMATMPGLPMFGHGQVEGFTEKYGMEYRRAYKDERPDENLCAPRTRDIPAAQAAPAFLGSRRVPAVRYDSWRLVRSMKTFFAYTNGYSGAHAIVLYNNAWERTSGRITRSCPYAEKGPMAQGR